MKIETLGDFLIYVIAICASLAMGFMLGLTVGDKEPRVPEERRIEEWEREK